MEDERKVVKVVTSGVPEIYGDVHIYDSVLNHISEKHKEEFSRIDEVFATIENPDRVHGSKTRAGSFILISETSTSRSGDPLRVVVKLTSDTNAAIMSTAYFSSSKDQGKLLWPKEENE